MTTIAHALFRQVKKILPPHLSEIVRRLGTALLTPIAFSRDLGHFRSSLRARSVSRRGEPIPWYTYPAIQFLDANDLSDLRVLEFGAGHSTLWWARRARSVLAIEADPQWVTTLKPHVPKNAEVRYTADDVLLASVLGADSGPYDVIVIDGLNRYAAAKLAPDLLNDAGAVLLDDSDGFWGSEGTYPIIDLFRDAGFLRIDFYGFAPGVRLPHCTSLFFQSGQRCRLLLGVGAPVRERAPGSL